MATPLYGKTLVRFCENLDLIPLVGDTGAVLVGVELTDLLRTDPPITLAIPPHRVQPLSLAYSTSPFPSLLASLQHTCGVFRAVW